MKKYIKKPVVVEAFQWDGTLECLTKNVSEEDLKYYFETVDHGMVLRISSSEGVMSAYIRDYVIKGITGEYYPCHEDIFLKTYEEKAPK